MADGQRNGPCSCGSGRKAKRCCGVRRGPSEAELARAWLDVQARAHARALCRLDDDQLEDLYDEMTRLPRHHMSLQLPLPRLLPPELEALRTVIVEEDVDQLFAAVPAALARADSAPARRALAEAVLAARDEGRVDQIVASAAIVDLAAPGESRLFRDSLLEAVAVSAGAAETPSGLIVAAR
jgi:hypothetical protein